MVTWRMLRDGLSTEVAFNAEDTDAWTKFHMKSLGIAVRQELSMSCGLIYNSNEAKEVPAERRRHLSLLETYYAVSEGLLLYAKPLRELWDRFGSSSATFARDFVLYQHFRNLGWILKSGLNYGANYVLYRGSAAQFHSEYIVYVQDESKDLLWNTIQSLTRIAADVKKTVLLCSVTESINTCIETSTANSDADLTFGVYNFFDNEYTIEAIAIRFWDASKADGAQSYAFQHQTVLLKGSKHAKKRKKAKSQIFQDSFSHNAKDSKF
ncbi:hypothetical protein CCR75_009567 [Bremia lactucae]|uniref:tRNA-intron lyase n=1 Tax=Bremia lactucae TaxID=4779 RepID=A0A976ILN6_BRELC|nr:hypothetical protein CCR75_009567 [Bremia lactucae]